MYMKINMQFFAKIDMFHIVLCSLKSTSHKLTHSLSLPHSLLILSLPEIKVLVLSRFSHYLQERWFLKITYPSISLLYHILLAHRHARTYL